MSSQESWTEYHVYVPDRGFYTDFMPNASRLDPNPKEGATELEVARTLLTRAKNMYRDIGFPEIAETLRIVSRTVTVTRTDWGVPVTMKLREPATP